MKHATDLENRIRKAMHAPITATAEESKRIDLMSVRGTDQRNDLGPLCIRCGRLVPMWRRVGHWLRRAWNHREDWD